MVIDVIEVNFLVVLCMQTIYSYCQVQLLVCKKCLTSVLCMVICVILFLMLKNHVGYLVVGKLRKFNRCNMHIGGNIVPWSDKLKYLGISFACNDFLVVYGAY